MSTSERPYFRPRIISPAKAKLRARVAVLTRHGYPSDHPKVTEARQQLKAVIVEEYVAKALPELTTDQRNKLADLLRGAR